MRQLLTTPFVAALYICAAVFTPSHSEATPILLAATRPGIDFSGLCFLSPASQINFKCPEVLTFNIYMHPLPGDTTAVPFGIALFGEHLEIPLETVGTHDFNESNAPGFSAIVAKLVDNTHSAMVFHFPLGSDVNDRFGNGELAIGGLLTARTIDFIRLSFFEQPWISDGTAYTVLSAQWQFWGSGDPLASAAGGVVAEPGTLALLFASVPAFMLLLTRGSTSRPPSSTRKPRGIA